MGLRVLLADDHPVFRQGLRALLEREKFDVVGEASDGLEAIAAAERLQPQIVVIDLAMPALNGIDAAREIVKRVPRAKAVLLTMHTEEHHVLEALRAGVKACVSKSQAAEHLLQAIKDVSAGGVYLSPHISGAVVQAYLAKTELPYDPLTPRERQVLQLIAEGKTTKEAAAVLDVSVKTAETHRTNLMEKLDIHSTAGLVRYAIRRGLLQP
ncbi:MAG TPA: response regulator transcription factor [Vicinamibacterales bacterium]|nr:response regulator transcription factor [Vicinamibacterales bacterium]